ncbi:MAG: alpha/beta hydrolase [Filomicrobium sp.]
MSEIPDWLMIAGILLLAVVMYAVAWRIVEGTHIVVRATTRILLGALIVVPIIMATLFAPGGMMEAPNKVGSGAPPPPMQQEQAAEAEPPLKSEQKSKPVPKPKKAAEAAQPEEPAAPPVLIEEELTGAPAEEAADGASAPVTDRAEATPEGGAPPAAANGDETTTAEAEEAADTTPISRPKRRERGRGFAPTPGVGTSDVTETAEETAAPADPKPDAAAPDFEVMASEEEPAVAAPEIPDVAALEAPPEASTDGIGGSTPPPSPTQPERQPPPSPGAGSSAPEAATEKSEEEKDWSIVPVFYGTDRQRTETSERVTYDWQRGRQLDLGRALVTVPKKHQMPMVERPWAIRIPYVDITLYEAAEDPKEHFTLKEIKSLSEEEFLKLVRERLAKSARFKDHALVFVHGYKTKFDNAVYRTAQIAYDLKFDGAPFLYSWPSGGTLQGYTYDRESAAQAEPFLRDFLKLVRDKSGAKKLSIIAHSMGNQPLLRVLQDLKRSLPDGVLISQLILAAPDVDRDNFENIVSSIAGIAEGITLYAAANDAALKVSRRVNGGIPRAGDVPEGGPIVLNGIDTIDATATSMDSVGINHSGYAENNALLQDIGKLIGTGIRPPEVRLPKLERVETEKGNYWRYPGDAGR